MVRTIEQSIAYIKNQDPNTALTKNALRQLIITNKLPSVKVGKKYLVNIENLFAYLSSNTSSPVENVSGIRKLSEKLR